MTDLNAAIRAKAHEISQRLDDDCNMQCGVSCASQGYSDITRGLLAVLDVHKSCSDNCGTVRAVAAALEIEPA